MGPSQCHLNKTSLHGTVSVSFIQTYLAWDHPSVIREKLPCMEPFQSHSNQTCLILLHGTVSQCHLKKLPYMGPQMFKTNKTCSQVWYQMETNYFWVRDMVFNARVSTIFQLYRGNNFIQNIRVAKQLIKISYLIC